MKYMLMYWDHGHHQYGQYETKAEAEAAIQAAIDTEAYEPWDFFLVHPVRFTAKYTAPDNTRQTYKG